MSILVLWLIFGALIVIVLALVAINQNLSQVYYSLKHMRSDHEAFVKWLESNIHRR